MSLIPEIAAAVLTLLLGPCAVYLLSRNAPKRLPRFPVGVIDKYGDIILLPVFNALAVHYGILGLALSDMQFLLIAITVSYIITRVFGIWRKDFAKHDDWTRPKRGKFNVGGYYHLAFMFAQGAFIILSLLHLWRVWALWLPIAGFLCLVAYRYVELKKSR